jgi:hypothetical protein
MSTANDLIERMERETGQRIDDNGGDNFAMIGLIGAMAREMGKSSHRPHDDVAAGVVVKHGGVGRNSALEAMMLAGFDPADIHKMGEALK